MSEHDPQGGGAAGAAMLVAAADAVDDAARRLDLRVEGMYFRGPAAVRFRDVMSERHHRAMRDADVLRGIADEIRMRTMGS